MEIEYRPEVRRAQEAAFPSESGLFLSTLRMRSMERTQCPSIIN